MSDETHCSLAWLPIVLITLVAFGLRVWALDAVPPGVTHDEAAHLHDAQRIWEGYRPLYLTTAYGREPLYDYASAPLVGLLGMKVPTGRLASALWGTALVVLLYGWVLRAFDRPTAILAAGLVAVSFWPVATSRQILRSITIPAVLVGAVLMFWQGVYPRAGRHRLRHFLYAGLLLGLGWYTYLPARITWLAPALFGGSLALTDRPRWRQIWRGLVLMLVVMGLVALPLVAYLARHPELEVRVAELAAPLRSLQEGDWGPLWSRLRQTALLFSHQGDVQWIYNISGRPLLPPVLAVLFFAGIGIAVVEALRGRQLACRLLLLWLVLGAAPALVTGLESSSLRAIAAQPAVYALAALAAATLGRMLVRLAPDRLARAGLPFLVGAGLGWAGTCTVVDYFHTWADHRDTRVAYHTHLVEMVRYVARGPQEMPTGISTLYPGPLHDPYAADVILTEPEQSETIRWYDGRSALVFPDAEQAAALFPALAPLDPILMSLFEPAANLVERVTLRPDDLSPWFTVYSWEPRKAQSGLQLDRSANLGEVLTLVGQDLRTPEIAPGGTVELITFWVPRIRPAADFELVLFTHLVQGGRVVAQQDRLDVPPSSWRPGELFAQLHRFSLPADEPAGVYTLEGGAYQPGDPYSPLPVYEGGRELGNRVVLSSVEVRLLAR
jgi:4-amino-4-deoxy-L-arabinose transferase-like glycosyltransferase